MEKVDPEDDGEPAPTSRESPQEANPPGETEEAEQEAGGGEGGCREDKAEDEPGPERRKGRRSGKNPGLGILPFGRPPLPGSPFRSHHLVACRPIWPEKVFSLTHWEVPTAGPHSAWPQTPRHCAAGGPFRGGIPSLPGPLCSLS